MKNKQSEEPGYKNYIFLMIVVIVLWGIVPGFAQLGGLPGDITTFYVNWVAVITLAIILTFKGMWRKFKTFKKKDYIKLTALGIVWPFIYSVAYFQSIKEVGAGFTTILNYTWPLFFILSSMVIYGKRSEFLSKSAYKYLLPILLAVGAVPVYMYGGATFMFSWAILFGLVAALTQGSFSFISGERTKDPKDDKFNGWLSFSEYDPWMLTFVIEFVTAVLVTILIMFSGNFVIPDTTTFMYLAILGAASNGIGFWAFVKGSGLSAKLAKGKEYKRDPLWLIGVSLVPISQILFLPLMNIEVPKSTFWALALIAASLVLYRLFMNKED